MQIINKISPFTAGRETHDIYRIPGIVVTKKGTILVYCEGRTGRSDWSATNIVLRRSVDDGASFEDSQLIAGCGENEAVNNPVMIASSDGSVHFLWQKLYRRTFYQKSIDDGLTFSAPVEITDIFNQYRDKGIEWNVYALGPGHGIEHTNGRLIVPVWIAFGKGNDHGPACVSTIYSDDGGSFWHTGDIVKWDKECPNMNETAAVELSDGSVMLNIRNHSPSYRRATTISKTGYSDFSPYRLEEALPDPICFGSIAKGTINGDNVTGFINCATYPTKANKYLNLRSHLTVRLSYDDAKTWKYSREIENRSGYADIAFSIDGSRIYCFYEHDVDDIIKSEPRHLTFAKINFDWIKD